jgi:hypothetical protein
VDSTNPLWGITGDEALERYAPEVSASFRELTRLCPQPLETAVLLTPEFGEFLRQFRADVTQISDHTYDAFADVAGEQLVAATQVVWIADIAPRLRAALDQVFTTSDWPVQRTMELPDIEPGIDDFFRSITRLDRVGPVMSELLRLRGGRLHQCPVCLSRRSSEALAAGADDATFAVIDDYEPSTLPDSAKAALALADAMILTPHDIDPDVVARVHEHLEPAVAVEILCDVARNAINKMWVALRTDKPEVTDGVQVFTWQQDGSWAILDDAMAQEVLNA